MSDPALEAYEALEAAEDLGRRLRAAEDELAMKPGLAAEKTWLAQAIERLAQAREGTDALAERALQLPALASLRGDHHDRLQARVVDAVEQLRAGIVFHAGPRAPLLDALFGKVKLAATRRLGRQPFEAFCADLERRLASSYARRMFGDAQLAAVAPVAEAVQAAIHAWRTSLAPPPLSEAEARALADELDAAARALALPSRQARALAEAALAPVRELLEATGLAGRVKRKPSRLAEEPEAASPSEEA